MYIKVTNLPCRVVILYSLSISNSIFNSNNIIFYVTTKDIYKMEIAYKRQTLEHNCALQESLCLSREVTA